MVQPLNGNPVPAAPPVVAPNIAPPVPVATVSTPIASPIASDAMPATKPDVGWASRKLIAAVGSAGLSLVTAYAFLWFGHISEPSAVQLIEGSLILVGTYCGFNVVSQLVTVAGQVFGQRK